MTQFTSIWVTQSHKHIALAQKFHTPKYPFAYLSCETQRISLLWFCERGSATNNSSESYNFQTLKIKKNKKIKHFFLPQNMTPLNAFHWNLISTASTPSIHFSLPHFVVFSCETMITLNLSFPSQVDTQSPTTYYFPPDLKTILYPSHKKFTHSFPQNQSFQIIILLLSDESFS